MYIKVQKQSGTCFTGQPCMQYTIREFSFWFLNCKPLKLFPKPNIILEMEEETSILSWKSFQPHLSSTLDELYQSQNFTDVTLVSDDQIHTKAHKSILSASSPVLKNLLITNPNSHPIL